MPRASSELSVTIDPKMLCQTCCITVRKMAAKQRKAGPPNLTARQLEVALTYIRYERIHNIAPTFDEVADMMTIKRITVFEHVVHMQERGYLTRDKHRSRGVRFVPRFRTWLESVLGQSKS
ncbi:MAG: hypothetical protein IPK83_18590 [Planctomycetes bacterium]|nr:hypothetical protein [Planctomycetota bacterium]